MYSNIVKELVFQYIEHSILRYDFVYDIIMYFFQVLPLLHWTSELSKINIIMYFSHHFPLTSHIRGHLLSTQMALLRLSADIPYVGTQKDILGLKFAKTLYMGMNWDAFTLKTACYIIFLSVELHTWLSPLQLAYRTRLSALKPAYISVRRFPLRNPHIIHGLPISIVVYTLLWP